MLRRVTLSLLLAVCGKLAVDTNASSAAPAAYVYVKFVTYNNAKGVGANGQCCDGRWSICQKNGCDHTFRICFDKASGVNANVYSCKYGYKQSKKIKNQDKIQFGDVFGDVRNPIKLALPVIPESGKVALKVDVWDDDGTLTDRDYVDTLRTLISVNPKEAEKSLVIGSRTKLSVRWFTKCGENLYGARCTVRCEPGKHHTCDADTGIKICDKGWGGDNCDKLVWCYRNPCRNGGTCRAKEGGYTCKCPRGYSGLNCEIQGSPCDLNPCLPGGCINYVTSYICVCPPGYIASRNKLNDSCVESPTTLSPSTTITECVCPTSGQKTTTSSPATTSTTTSSTTSTTTSTTAATTTTTKASSGKVEFIDRPNADCDRLALNGRRYRDGVYNIHVSTLAPFPVYCDMSSEGWTVIQERVNGELNLYRNWQDYKKGFGEVGFQKNYFLGLEKIYYLTNQRSYKLRITMRIGDGTWRYANYDRFYIENEAHNYRLHVEGYNGNAGDALGQHDGAPFSTYDHNDEDDYNRSCGAKFQSGWWFFDKPDKKRQCYAANLNGVYPRKPVYGGWPPCKNRKCISWETIRNYKSYSLVRTQMKILPNPRS